MALLYFEVEADWTKVVKLRDNIDMLEKKLKTMDTGTEAWNALKAQIDSARAEYKSLTDAAAKLALERRLSLQNEVEASRKALNEIVKQHKQTADDINDIEKRLANLRAKNAGKSSPIYQSNIDALEIQLAQKRKDLAALDPKVIDRQFDFNTKNSALHEFDSQGRYYERTTQLNDALQMLSSRFQEIHGKSDGVFDEATKSANGLKNIFNDLLTMTTGVAIGNLVSGGIEAGFDKLQGMYQHAVDVRKEMQDIESTMKVFLGGEEPAMKFVGELEDAAYYNMFEFADLVSASKDMIAYGIQTDQIIPKINQLSEVATATGNSLGQLVSMYDRAKSIGYVDSRSQMTWASNGIVLKDVLKEMGVAASGTKVTFEQLNQALDYLTQEGGRFHGIMASQLSNISAEEGQLEDNLHSMYNEIGKMLEKPYINSLKFQNMMVDNWKEIATVIVTVVSVIGTYRAALVALHAIKKLTNTQAVAEKLLLNAISLAKEKDTLAAIADTGAHVGLTKAMKLYAKAALEAAAATLANPYVLLAAAIAAVVGGITYLLLAESGAEKAAEQAAEAHKAYREELEKTKEEEQKTAKIISDGTKTLFQRKQAYEELAKSMPKLREILSFDEMMQMKPEDIEKKITELQQVYERAEVADLDRTASKYANGMPNEPFDFRAIQRDYNKVADAMGVPMKERTVETHAMVGFLQAASEEYRKQHEEMNQVLLAEMEAKKTQAERIDDAKAHLSDLEKEQQAIHAFLDNYEAIKEAQEKVPWMFNMTPEELAQSDDVHAAAILAYKSAQKAADENIIKFPITLFPNAKETALAYAQSVENEVKTAKNYVETLETKNPTITANQKELQKEYNQIKKLQQQFRDGNVDVIRDSSLVNQLMDTSSQKTIKSIIEGAANGLTSTEIATINDLLSQQLKTVKDNYEGQGGTDLEGERAKQRLRQSLQNARDIRDAERKNERALLDYKMSLRQHEIDMEHDMAKKLQDQRQLDYDKSLEQAKRAYDDAVKQAEDASRKRFEADLKNKDRDGKLLREWNEKDLKNDSIYKAQVAIAADNRRLAERTANEKFSGVDDIISKYRKGEEEYDKQKATMSEELQKLYDERTSLTELLNNNLARPEDIDRLALVSDLISEIIDKRNALLDEATNNRLQYESTYGDIAQRESAINRIYEAKIKGEKDEYKRMMLEEERDDKLRDLPSKYVQDSIKDLKKDNSNYRVFSDIKHATDYQMEKVRASLQQTLADPKVNVDPQVVEEIEKYIRSIDEELNRRDGFGAFGRTFKDVNKAESDVSKWSKALKLYNKKGSYSEDGKTYTKQELEQLLADATLNRDEKLNELMGVVDRACNSVDKLGGQLSSLGDAIGGKFGSAISSVGNIMQTSASAFQNINSIKEDVAAGNYGKGMGNAMGIMAGVQAGISVGSTLTNYLESVTNTSGKKYEKYARKLAEQNKLTQSVMSYQRAMEAARRAEQNWFANDSLQNLRDSWADASASAKQYFTKLHEQQATYLEESKHDGDWIGNVIAGSIAGAVTGFFAGGGNIYTAAAGGIIGGIAGATTSYAEQAFGNTDYNKRNSQAMDNLRIETQSKKKSFMWFGGRDQKTQDLRSWAREKYGDDLFDAEGWINTELANKLIDDWGDKLVGETQDTIEQLIALKEQYDEYKEQLREYVSSLYSPITDGMVDAMWEWYETGKDALSAFRESAGDTFRAIMNDMLKTIVMKNVLGSFSDDIEDLYDRYARNEIDEGTLMNQVMQNTDALMSRYETQMPVLQNLMTQMGDRIQQSGIDVTGGGSVRASSGVAANVTQDSIDETNGRMAAIQMIQQQASLYLASLDAKATTNIDKMSAFSGEFLGLREQISQSFQELEGIHSDTSGILEGVNKIINNYLKNWDEPIKQS